MDFICQTVGSQEPFKISTSFQSSSLMFKVVDLKRDPVAGCSFLGNVSKLLEKKMFCICIQSKKIRIGKN